MSYDKQVILVVGDLSDILKLGAFAKKLKSKDPSLEAKTTYYEIETNSSGTWTVYYDKEESLTNDLGSLTRNSRLYIVAEGYVTTGGIYVAFWQPEWFAKMLADLGLSKQVGKISLVACEAARTKGWSRKKGSWAKEFHRILGKTYGIFTILYARTQPLTIRESGQKFTVFTSRLGRDSVEHHHKKSKMDFFWRNSEQEQEYHRY